MRPWGANHTTKQIGLPSICFVAILFVCRLVAVAAVGEFRSPRGVFKNDLEPAGKKIGDAEADADIEKGFPEKSRKNQQQDPNTSDGSLTLLTSLPGLLQQGIQLFTVSEPREAREV